MPSIWERDNEITRWTGAFRNLQRGILKGRTSHSNFFKCSWVTLDVRHRTAADCNAQQYLIKLCPKPASSRSNLLSAALCWSVSHLLQKLNCCQTEVRLTVFWIIWSIMQFSTQCTDDCGYLVLIKTANSNHIVLKLKFFLLSDLLFWTYIFYRATKVLSLSLLLSLQRILIDLFVLDRMNRTDLMSPGDESQIS